MRPNGPPAPPTKAMPTESFEGGSVSSQHTPGPWSVDPIFGGYIWGPDMEMVADFDDEQAYLCRMRGVGAKLPIEANARLIAAAPDLLDLAESVSLGDCYCDAPDEEDADFIECDPCLAAAAINKARGTA